MPDAQGNYLGDYAGVLPDHSAQVIHMADQYAAINMRNQAVKAAKDAANQKRNSEYYKLVGSTFDVNKWTDQHPYQEEVTKQIAANNQKYNEVLSHAAAEGKTIDEGYLRAAMTADLAKIKTNNDLSKAKADEIKTAVKALATEKGIDGEKLLGLALHDYFNSTGPDGKVGMDPKKWDKNKTGADVVKAALEKYPALISTDDGVQEELVGKMQKDQAAEYKTAGTKDDNGQEITPSIDLKLKRFQQVNYDKNGLPTKLDIKQEPVILPNGETLKNPDGTPRMTIAKDLEKEALSNLGFAISVKKELHQAIGDENQRRHEINDNLKKQGLPPTLQMITGDSEEAKLINSDIILKRYRAAMQGGGIDIKENKDFENRMRLLADQRAKEGLRLREKADARAEAKANQENADANPESPLTKLARERGQNIALSAKEMLLDGSRREKKIVYVDKIDPKELAIIKGIKPKADQSAMYGGAAAPPVNEIVAFKDENGRDYYEVEDKTGDFIGTNGRYTVDATKDAMLKTYTDGDTRGSSYSNPKPADEPAPAPKSTYQKGIDYIKEKANKVKAAVTPKKKIKGTKEKMY